MTDDQTNSNPARILLVNDKVGLPIDYDYGNSALHGMIRHTIEYGYPLMPEMEFEGVIGMLKRGMKCLKSAVAVPVVE